MSISAVLNRLKHERDRAANKVKRLDRAIGALAGLSSHNSFRRRRRLSAAARRRIIMAQKARWARVAAATEGALKGAVSLRPHHLRPDLIRQTKERERPQTFNTVTTPSDKVMC